MIAAAIPTRITQPICRVPRAASTPHAISAVSPGSGSPNDSSATSAKSRTSAQSWLPSMKPLMDASSTPRTMHSDGCLHPERPAEACSPFGRDGQGSGDGAALDPAECEELLRELATDDARQMVALLGPVDAVAERRRAVVVRRRKVDPEVAQPVAAVQRQPVGEIAAGRRETIGAGRLDVVHAVAADDAALLEEHPE